MELASFIGACPPTGGTNCLDAPRPASSNKLGRYADPVYSTPGLRRDDLGRFFKDASFGVRPGEEARRYTPHPDVTVTRDRAFGVPHIYGRTRDGAMFGAGYAGAEDRLFLMDVLRFDAARHRPVGAISQPLIHRINRPTFQQVVEVRRRVPR